jgi:hypothetical protein
VVTTAEPRPFVTDDLVVHGVLALLGLARVVAAVASSETWGAGATLGLILALGAIGGLFRRGKS